MKLRITIATCIAALAAAAPAAATTETASSGPLTATFSYDQPADGQYSNLSLRIATGAASIDIPVESPDCGTYCWPGGVGQRPSVHVRDLDGNGTPEVLLDLFTGGAHCCSIAQVYEPDLTHVGATIAYTRFEYGFGNASYKVTDLDGDGTPEFKSADDAFAYLLSSYAESGFPVKILHWTSGGFTDVTRDFPALVRKDAAYWFKHYRKDIRRKAPFDSPGKGAFTAYIADEYLLGDGKRARAEIKTARRHGWVTAKDVKLLNKQLAAAGYLVS
jgi:hypothetical protein